MKACHNMWKWGVQNCVAIDTNITSCQWTEPIIASARATAAFNRVSLEPLDAM